MTTCISFIKSQEQRCTNQPQLGSRFCSEHFLSVTKAYKRYKLLQERAHQLIETPDPLVDNYSDYSSIEKIKACIEYYKSRWKVFFRLHNSRKEFRDKYISLECRDNGHDYQIELALGFAARYERVMSDIGQLLTQLNIPEPCPETPVDDDVKNIKLIPKKKKGNSKVELPKKMKELENVCEEALLSNYINEVKTDTESLNLFETTFLELSKTYWILHVLGHSGYQQKSFIEFVKIPPASASSNKSLLEYSVNRTPSEKQELNALYIKAIRDLHEFKNLAIPSSDLVDVLNTKLNLLKYVLVKQWVNRANIYVRNFESFGNNPKFSERLGVLDGRDGMMCTYYGLDGTIILQFAKRMFSATYKPSKSEYANIKKELLDYIVCCMMLRHVYVANMTLSSRYPEDSKKRNLHTLLVYPNKKVDKFDELFCIKIDSNTPRDDVIYYTQTYLLVYLANCYVFDLSSYITQKIGLDNMAMVFGWAYHKASKEFQVW